MGDLFFLLKMTIYTLIIVVVLQVKIGPTTLEQKVVELTHNSQMAGVLQNVAQGAATFIGVQYNRVTGHVKSKYIDQHRGNQIPGERLKVKLNEWKKSINSRWDEEKKTVSRLVEEQQNDPKGNDN